MSGILHRSTIAQDACGDAPTVRKPQSGLPLDLRDGHPVLPVNTARRRRALGIKRVLDVTVALLALASLAPLIAVLALLIAVVDRRVPIRPSLRMGRGGQAFSLFDFLTRSSGVAGPASRPTRLGAFIESTRLERLPRLINALAGDMALIGPAPHPVDTPVDGLRYDKQVAYYPIRQAMRPGLVGWAQVNGLYGPAGTANSARVRVDHDVAYIQHFSLALDAKILARALAALR